MRPFSRLILIIVFIAIANSLSAQNYRADRLKRAVEVLDLHIVPDSLMPERTLELKAKDGVLGEFLHGGVPP